MKKAHIALGLLVLICLLLNLTSFRIGHEWGDDYAAYVIQAKTIASGDYDHLKELLTKNDFILNYPWGFPSVISPVIGFFDTNIQVVKIYLYSFFIIGLLLFFILFREEKETALFAIVLVCANPYFWEFKDNILADFPNLCFVICTLLLIDQIVLRKKIIINEYLSGFLIGLSVFLSYIMRNQSIVLLPTLLAMQIFTQRLSILKPSALVKAAIPYLSFGLLIFLFSQVFPVKAVSYINAYSDMHVFQTVYYNIFYYINIFHELFNGIKVLSRFPDVFTGIALLLVLIGIAVDARKNILYIVFFIFSLGLVLISPFYQGVRYLLPFIPFFFFFFVKGIYLCISAFCKNRPVIYYATVLTVVFLTVISLGSRFYHNYKTPQTLDGAYTKESLEMFSFIKSNTTKDDLLNFRKSRALLLYTGRNCLCNETLQLCLDRHVTHFVCEKGAWGQVPVEAAMARPDVCTPVFENAKFVVFKVKQPGAG